jgi:hypothetical protein
VASQLAPPGDSDDSKSKDKHSDHPPGGAHLHSDSHSNYSGYDGGDSGGDHH